MGRGRMSEENIEEEDEDEENESENLEWENGKENEEKEENKTSIIIGIIIKLIALIFSCLRICMLCDIVSILFYLIYVILEELFKLLYPLPMKSLFGERILITGAANGIGREICLHLAKTGATLICWDIDTIANEILREDLTEAKAKAYIYEVDVSDRAKVTTAAAMVKKNVGPITMIINNAGIMPYHTFLSHNPKELERLFQVNVLAHFWLLREFLPNMIKNRKGHIVTITSATGVLPTKNVVPYSATKYAVQGYVEALKEEIRQLPQKTDIKFTNVYYYSLTCNNNSTDNSNTNSNGIKFFTRFPFIRLQRKLEPKDVASKLVEGMRRNYEYVYVPAIFQVHEWCTKLLPRKVVTVAADYFDAYIEPIGDH